MGPQSIIEASAQVDLFDADFGEFDANIHCEAVSEVILSRNNEALKLAHKARLGDKSALAKVNELTQQNNKFTYLHAKKALASGSIPIVLGGDHSVPLGSIQAIGEKHENFGILHIDAHADLREAYEGFNDSHASIMYNVLESVPSMQKLVAVGIRDFCKEEQDLMDSSPKVKTFFDANLRTARLSGQWLDKAKEIISELPEHVYISFDIDGLDPTLCPSTGTPVPGGLSWDEMSSLLFELKNSGKKIVGMDLCEVTPNTSTNQLPAESWDAIVGARVLFKLIGFAKG